MAKILIIDDDQEIVKILQRHLKVCEAEIEVAYDGYEALKHIGQREEPSVVILDIMMPGRSGLDLLTVINAKWPSANIYLFTGYSDYDDNSHLDDYIAGFFQKNPHQMKTLVAKVKRDIKDVHLLAGVKR